MLLGITTYSRGWVKGCKNRNWKGLSGFKALRGGSMSMRDNWYVTIKGVHPFIEGALEGHREVEVKG